MRSLFGIILLLFFSFPISSAAQTSKIDSLQNLLSKATHDTTKASLLWQIGWELKFSDPEKAKKLGQEALDLSLKTGYRRTEGWAYNLLGAMHLLAHENKEARVLFEKGLDAHRSVNNIKGMASCYSNIANIFTEASLFDSALAYQENALKYRLQLTDKKPAADSYNNLGNIYNLKGEYGKAAEYLFKALKVYEQIGDNYGTGLSYYNIGRTYYTQQFYDKAIEYAAQSLPFREKIGDKRGIADSYVLISGSKQMKKEYSSAAEDLKKAITLQKEIGDNYGLQFTYSQLGVLFFNMKQYDLSIEYHLQSRALAVETNTLQSIGAADYLLGETYKAKRDYPKAIGYELKALQEAKQIGALEEQKSALLLLHITYAEMKDYDKAYEYQSKYIALKDSMQTEGSTKQLQELQTQYDTEKKQKEIELLTKNKEIQDGKMIQQRIISYAVFAGLLLVLVLAFITYKRYKEKQKANELLAQQKVEILSKNQDLQTKNDMIEHQKKEITDSIEYAKTIQHAMLPNEDEIRDVFAESFVLFKPKDIVSGDFYWFRKIGSVHFVAAADCTGHGVPGAFMSMIGNDKLNFAVQEKRLVKPSEILSELNRGVKAALKQNETASKSRDGMDIAFCAFDASNKKLEYAGANRVLYKISEGILTEYAPTKSAIGGFTSENLEFSNNNIEYKQGDMFYLFTDGYADQFGGESGKKLMTKNFKRLLLSVASEPLNIQKQELGKTFDVWKGPFDQIDDVLVIGLRM